MFDLNMLKVDLSELLKKKKMLLKDNKLKNTLNLILYKIAAYVYMSAKNIQKQCESLAY